MILFTKESYNNFIALEFLNEKNSIGMKLKLNCYKCLRETSEISIMSANRSDNVSIFRTPYSVYDAKI